MNTDRKITLWGVLVKIPPAIVAIGIVIGVIMARYQSDLRGIANCGSWKAPVFVAKELKEETKANVELFKTMHTISVQNYGERVIKGLVLVFKDAVCIQVQKNDDDPTIEDCGSAKLGSLEPNIDTIIIRVWTKYPAFDRSEFKIGQDPSAGTEIADIHCVTPVTAIAAMVNKHSYITRGLIFVFVYLFCGFLYLWLRPKLSKRGQTSPQAKRTKRKKK